MKRASHFILTFVLVLTVGIVAAPPTEVLAQSSIIAYTGDPGW